MTTSANMQYSMKSGGSLSSLPCLHCRMKTTNSVSQTIRSRVIMGSMPTPENNQT